MANGPDEHLTRWTAKRRAGLVMEILRGDLAVAEAARTHGVTVAELEDWRERFLAGAENALCSRPADEDAHKDREIKRLKQKVGAFVMDVDTGTLWAKEAINGHPSLRQMRDA